MAQLQIIDRNIQEGAWNDAWDRLRRALNTKPGDSDLLTRLWTVVQSEPSFRDRAIELLTETLPDDPSGRTDLMLSLLGSDREARAEMVFTEVHMERSEGNPLVGPRLDPFAEGRRLQALNDFEGAGKAYEEVGPGHPNYLAARTSINVIRDIRMPPEVRVLLSPGALQSQLNAGTKASGLEIKRRIDLAEQILAAANIKMDLGFSMQIEGWRKECNIILSCWDLTEQGERAESEGRLADAAHAYRAALQEIPQFGPALGRLSFVETANANLSFMKFQLAMRRPDELALLRAVEHLQEYLSKVSSNSGELVDPLRRAEIRLDQLATLRLDEVRRLMEQADVEASLSGRILLLETAKQLVDAHVLSLTPESEDAITVADRLSVSLAQSKALSALRSSFSEHLGDLSFGSGEFAGAVTLLNSVASPLTLLTDTVVFRRDLVSYACNMGVRKLASETGGNSLSLDEADEWYEAGVSAMGQGATVTADLVGLGRRISHRRRIEMVRMIGALLYRVVFIVFLIGLGFYAWTVLFQSEFAR